MRNSMMPLPPAPAVRPLNDRSSTSQGFWLEAWRWMRRRGWDVVKILLVVITTLFFLLQSQCRQWALVHDEAAGACNLILPRLMAPVRALEQQPLAWEE